METTIRIPKSKAKKTFKVDTLRDLINKRLTYREGSAENRQVYIEVLEMVLHSCDAYHGFRYLEQHEVPEGEKPGIYWDNGTPIFENTDRTRVFYY
jgi:hypothetical protein